MQFIGYKIFCRGFSSFLKEVAILDGNISVVSYTFQVGIGET
jgi:hypothetical protein